MGLWECGRERRLLKSPYIDGVKQGRLIGGPRRPQWVSLKRSGVQRIENVCSTYVCRCESSRRAVDENERSGSGAPSGANVEKNYTSICRALAATSVTLRVAAGPNRRSRSTRARGPPPVFFNANLLW